MALTPTEQKSLLELKSRGYTFQEAMGFIASNRFGQESRVTRDLLEQQKQPERSFLQTVGSVLKDIPEDISTGYDRMVESTSAGMQKADETLTQVESGEISPIAGTAKTIGAGLSAGVGVVGSAFQTLAKLPFTQKAEEGMAKATEGVAQKAMQTRPVQAGMEMYAGMTPEQKAYAQGAVGVGEAALSMVGLGAGSKVASRGAEAIKNASKGVIRAGIDGIDDATALLVREGITEVGQKGIQQASAKAPGYAESLMQRVARVSKGKQAAFEQMANESIGTYLVKRGIFGTPDDIVDQLYTRMELSKSRLDRAIQSVKGNHRAPALKNALDELWERENKVGGVGMTSPDGLRIRELAKKHANEGLLLKEVNEVKRLYERNVKLDYVQDINPVGLERAKRIDTALRTLVEDEAAKRGITVVRELNRETRLARQLADDLGAEYSGKAGNNLVGLTDWIMLAQSANNPTAAAGFMAKKFFGSEKVMSATAQLLARNKAVMKDLPVPGKVNNQPPISGYAAFVEAHADAFPDAQARQSVQSTPATQKQVSQKVVASQATVPQPAPASTRQSTAARPTGQKTSSLSNGTTRPISVAKQKLQELQEQIKIQESILDENPAKQLMRYVGKGDNSLSEVNYRAMGTDRKAAKLDDLVKELGYKDLDDAQAGIDNYVRQRDALRSQRAELRVLQNEVRNGEDLLTYDTPEYTAPTLSDADNIEILRRLTRERGAAGAPSDEWLLAQAKRELKKTPNDAKLKAFIQEKELAVEARKYKTAEEFVKAQGEQVFHGGDNVFASADELKFGDGSFGNSGFWTLKKTAGAIEEIDTISGGYFTPEQLKKMPAEAFGKNVTEFRVNLKNPKTIDAKGQNYFDLETDEIARKAMKNGHDGLIIKNVNEGFSSKGTLGEEAGLVDDYVVFDKNAIKTRSQLTDIWNKAHGKK